MRTSTTPVLSRRALNRATLARQLLLRRSGMSVPEAVQHLLLSHADRGRVVTDDVRCQAYDPHGPTPQFMLIDGFTGGDWRITRQRRAATLVIRSYARLSDEDNAALVDEGATLLAFAARRRKSAMSSSHPRVDAVSDRRSVAATARRAATGPRRREVVAAGPTEPSAAGKL